MRDLGTVLWKEAAEFIGNPRLLRLFAFAVSLFGALPTVILAAHGGLTGPGEDLAPIYLFIASSITVSNVSQDMVLHERVGRTLDYLLATRLPTLAIYGGKVLAATAAGYVAALVACAIQLVVTGLFGGHGWSWAYLGDGAGRIIVFAAVPAIGLYMAVLGTFVALRIGDQRSGYLLTMLSLAVVAAPFLLGWLHISLTTSWLGEATAVVGAAAVLLAVIGSLLFRREMLVLYLQE